jgi:hypothetical protein
MQSLREMKQIDISGHAQFSLALAAFTFFGEFISGLYRPNSL